jgi:hypothetical protein
MFNQLDEEKIKESNAKIDSQLDQKRNESEDKTGENSLIKHYVSKGLEVFGTMLGQIGIAMMGVIVATYIATWLAIPVVYVAAGAILLSVAFIFGSSWLSTPKSINGVTATISEAA